MNSNSFQFRKIILSKSEAAFHLIICSNMYVFCDEAATAITRPGGSTAQPPHFSTALDVKCTNLFSVNLNISDVVLKHRRDVDFRKLVLAEDNQKTCFPTSSISDNHQLLPNGRHLCGETGGMFF